MTRERSETKYLLAAEQVASVIQGLSIYLPPHRFSGEGANRLPDPMHFVTTVYFDTALHTHYRAAAEDLDHNVKVRAKEYYDLHPSLAEVATDSTQIARYQPWIWFELKQRAGASTLKRRFRVPKHRLPELFEDGFLMPSALALPGQENQGPSDERQEVVRYCASLGTPMKASCLVNYRRLSFQDPEGSLRITLDLGLCFFAPPPDLWSRMQPLHRNRLGPSKGMSRDAVLEVKSRAAKPTWLSDLLAGLGDPLPFSKFVAANRAVYG